MDIAWLFTGIALFGLSACLLLLFSRLQTGD